MNIIKDNPNTFNDNDWISASSYLRQSMRGPIEDLWNAGCNWAEINEEVNELLEDIGLDIGALEQDKTISRAKKKKKDKSSG